MSLTIEELAAQVKADYPQFRIGIDKQGGLIAVYAEGEWVPQISATITGQWVYLNGQGLPLVNGERVYKQEDFTEV